MDFNYPFPKITTCSLPSINNKPIQKCCHDVWTLVTFFT